MVVFLETSDVGNEGTGSLGLGGNALPTSFLGSATAAAGDGEPDGALDFSESSAVPSVGWTIAAALVVSGTAALSVEGVGLVGPSGVAVVADGAGAGTDEEPGVVEDATTVTAETVAGGKLVGT